MAWTGLELPVETVQHPHGLRSECGRRGPSWPELQTLQPQGRLQESGKNDRSLCRADLDGVRAKIMLDECGLDYTLHKVNLRKGEHRTPKCKAMNPFAMTPVIVDRDGPVRDHFSAGLRRLGQRRPLVGRDEGAARGAEGPGFRLRVRGKRE